jgi:hypothetical protein
LEFQVTAGIGMALQKASAMLFYTIARGDGKRNLNARLPGVQLAKDLAVCGWAPPNLKGNFTNLQESPHGLHQNKIR